MIIGLTGQMGCGKDTVAAYLIKEHGFERKAFADPLKRSVAALFDIPFSEIDKLKNDSGCTVSIDGPVHRIEGRGMVSAEHSSMTFRELLQRYGTEAHRDIFGEDFWVDVTLPVQQFYGGRAIVISDLRFENEADRVNELGGFICRIHRPSSTSAADSEAPIKQQQHRSEQEQFGFGAHYNIVNDGTIEELCNKIEAILEIEGSIANA